MGHVHLIGVRASLVQFSCCYLLSIVHTAFAYAEFPTRSSHECSWNAEVAPIPPEPHSIHKSHPIPFPRGHMGTLLASASQSVPFQTPHLSCLIGSGQPVSALLPWFWSPGQHLLHSSTWHILCVLIFLSSFLLFVFFPLLRDPGVGSLAIRPSFHAELLLVFNVKCLGFKMHI